MSRFSVFVVLAAVVVLAAATPFNMTKFTERLNNTGVAYASLATACTKSQLARIRALTAAENDYLLGPCLEIEALNAEEDANIVSFFLGIDGCVNDYTNKTQAITNITGKLDNCAAKASNSTST